MKTKQQIAQDVKFFKEMRGFAQERLTTQKLASGAVMGLTLLATEIAFTLKDGDKAKTRDMLVTALNTALKSLSEQ